jgi:hypothetical protein
MEYFQEEKKARVTPLGYLKKCQTIELYWKLQGDLFNSDRMLVNGADLNIKLTRAPEVL